MNVVVTSNFKQIPCERWTLKLTLKFFSFNVMFTMHHENPFVISSLGCLTYGCDSQKNNFFRPRSKMNMKNNYDWIESYEITMVWKQECNWTKKGGFCDNARTRFSTMAQSMSSSWIIVATKIFRRYLGRFIRVFFYNWPS